MCVAVCVALCVIIGGFMATNLALDDKLIEEALKLGNHKTKRAAVTAALSEYIQRRKQKKIVSMFNNVDYDETYDYKAQRKIK